MTNRGFATDDHVACRQRQSMVPARTQMRIVGPKSFPLGSGVKSYVRVCGVGSWDRSDRRHGENW